MLELTNVSLHHPGTSKPALQHIHYRIEPGDFIILLGTNGSGKSTLLKLLQGENLNFRGKINFLGKSITHYLPQEIAKHIAQLSQNCNESLFPSLTLYENFLLTKRSSSLVPSKKDKLFLENYLQDFNPNLCRKLDVPIKELSGGEKQVVALALCLLHPPTLLLLDEHTSALDPKTSEQIMDITQKKIQEHGITCILTTHDLDIALRFGNRILMLNDGKMSNAFDAKGKQHLTREKLVKSYY